jgi:TolB-like protein/tetratricopeptide (TPR) repeat protein
MGRPMTWLFGDYQLDPARRELTLAGTVIATTPKVFDLLVHLLQHRERVVSRDELLAAVWDGRIVSESTLASHINAARNVVGDSGKQQRLIRTMSRKGFRFVGEVSEAGVVSEVDTEPSTDPGIDTATPDRAAATTSMLPARPSLAVLPFINLGADPQQDYFADGVVEDIIAALCRLRWLFVIARNSSFAYKGHARDVRDVGRELGVRYVLEGSVRKSADRVRLTGQLIDAATGEHLWSDRFEGVLVDIFELQDQLTESVVGAIATQLERAEIRRAKLKPTDSLDAYDCYLRGMASFHQGTRQAIDEALPFFHRAIALDPEYASAYGMAAWCHCWRKVNRWMDDPPRENIIAAQLARRAVELGKNDAIALTRGAHALGHFGGSIDHCNDLIDRALALDPNLAAAWLFSGFLRIWRGETDAAIERFEHAMRLNPLDPEMYRMQAGMALAHLLAGRHDEASAWAGKAYGEMPTFVMVVGIIAASHALAGKAQLASQAMQRLRQLDPDLRISAIEGWLPFHGPAHLATFVDGLRKAGLPA